MFFHFSLKFLLSLWWKYVGNFFFQGFLLRLFFFSKKPSFQTEGITLHCWVFIYLIISINHWRKHVFLMQPELSDFFRKLQDVALHISASSGSNYLNYKVKSLFTAWYFHLRIPSKHSFFSNELINFCCEIKRDFHSPNCVLSFIEFYFLDPSLNISGLEASIINCQTRIIFCNIGSVCSTYMLALVK